jgi:hypothetical protein
MNDITTRQTTATETPEHVVVHAHPQRITAGGVVLLAAEPPHEGTYDVEWVVEGPVKLSGFDAGVALLGATTVAGNRVQYTHGNPVRATLDTSRLTVGAWIVRTVFTPVPDPDARTEGDTVDTQAPASFEGVSDPIEVLSRPFAAGDDVAVTLKRAAVAPTSDQTLWVAIRNSTNALGFENYSRFMDRVMCGEWIDRADAQSGRRDTRHKLRKVTRRTALPFPNVDQYRLLKAATEVFLMIHCGVNLDDLDLVEESRRLNRTVQQGDIEAEFQQYLTAVPTGDDGYLDVLPYLGLIRLKLRDIAVVGSVGDDESARVCYGILADKLANPCFLELLWSFWNEKGGLPQALNAISWRFQNRASAADGRDPLAGLDIDPLRPLNNLLWGWVQDSGHRLTAVRRLDEYRHLYGLSVGARPRSYVRSADSRSRFVEAFHNLLTLCAEFYRDDDNTIVIADGFRVLNALREVHLLLSEGAHNQYGDLPWTARHEMLMEQWILSRPEVREFLPTRTMVAYPEAWMDRVEAMNRLQGWSDVSALHFRDLAVFGEQLLLGIRFGAWTQAIEPEQAANWARYWRPELQGYVHAYRAVTGIDLTQRVARAPAAALRRVDAYHN